MVAAGGDAGEFILIGKVAKPHGVRGEIKVYPYSGQPENFQAYVRIFVGWEKDRDLHPYAIEQCRVQGKLALLKLAGCTSREVAEEMVGREIWLHRNDLAELEDTEYYWLDLEGKKVITEDGLELGKVTAIYETGAHDIISVTGRDEEYLIPVHKDFIVRIDETEVVLSPPPGLLDINR